MEDEQREKELKEEINSYFEAYWNQRLITMVMTQNRELDKGYVQKLVKEVMKERLKNKIDYGY